MMKVFLVLEGTLRWRLVHFDISIQDKARKMVNKDYWHCVVYLVAFML